MKFYLSISIWAIGGAIAGSTLPLSAQTDPSPAPSPSADPVPNSSTVKRSGYAEFMRLGYAALQRKDYSFATSYFRQALYYNPRDRAATIVYWNARDELNRQKSGTLYESDYDRYMRIGYDATKRGDYQTASINFERALQERQGNYYATQALRNVSTYIARGEGHEIENLPAPIAYARESAYDRYMRLGYAAQQRQDNDNAFRYFLGALYEKPSDRLATIAFENTLDAIVKKNRANAPTAGLTEDKLTDYDRFMQLGYEATEQGDYSVALDYFRQALEKRAGDEYATRALRNVKAYVQLGQAHSE